MPNANARIGLILGIHARVLVIRQVRLLRILTCAINVAPEFRVHGEREIVEMNRFFSKLNLADIRIKAEGNSFPPDADEDQVVETEAQVETEAPAAVATAATVVEEPPVVAEEPAVVEVPQQEQEQEQEIPVASNGHSSSDVSYEESTALYSASAPSTVSENGSEDTAPVTEIVSEGIVIGIGEVLKVSARSRPSAVAGAIAGVVREAGKAEVQAIGAGATNQAIKAVAIARDYLSESGIEVVCVPAFIDVTIENEDRTAIRLLVEPR